MEVADALSRLSPESPDPIPGMNVQIHEIFPQFSSSMLQKIREQSSLDAELNALKEMIHAGWPAHIQQVPTPLKPYWPYRDELATEDEIVMKAHRIIISATLQREILRKLHAPHQGTERTKLKARTLVYWRGLYKDIEETTNTCSTCEKLQHSQQKEPLITTEVSPRAWYTIGADLFALNGSQYLVVADYYSKYPFVRNIPSGKSNSSTVVKIMRQLFSEQGQTFQEFAGDLGFKHITSYPYYPCSNGFIESQVKSVKSALLKSKMTKSDPDMSLLCLRATPVDRKLRSPAELLLGHPIQNNLPRKISRDPSSKEVVSRLIERQQLQKQYYDRSAKPLPELAPGQRITIHDPASLKWKPAEVKERIAGPPCPYAVTTATGRELGRNRAHIQVAHQDNRAVEPAWNEQSSSKDSPSLHSSSSLNPLRNETITSPETYTTRSGRLDL